MNFLIETIKHLLVSEIETKENAYIVFIFGFCLPTFICLYRSACILTGKSFLLPYYSFFFIDCYCLLFYEVKQKQ
jgi:hypothetical protein